MRMRHLGSNHQTLFEVLDETTVSLLNNGKYPHVLVILYPSAIPYELNNLIYCISSECPPFF